MTKTLSAKIVSIGAWGETFHNWEDLQARLQNQAVDITPAKGPKPVVIPANERRRAPLPVRLAVESSWQAVEGSSFASQDLACVFVSALGDTQLTDYMCKVLATESKQLSPTKFHNSVHNAAAGYWTISTECMQAANSIAGYEHSVPLTLLDALTQIEHDKNPMLVTFYDAPVSDVLKPLLKNDAAFAVSIILAPVEEGEDAPVLTASVSAGSVQWPELKQKDEDMARLYINNPTAKILALLETVLNGENSEVGSSVTLPLSEATSISFNVNH